MLAPPLSSQNNVVLLLNVWFLSLKVRRIPTAESAESSISQELEWYSNIEQKAPCILNTSVKKVICEISVQNLNMVLSIQDSSRLHQYALAVITSHLHNQVPRKVAILSRNSMYTEFRFDDGARRKEYTVMIKENKEHGLIRWSASNLSRHLAELIKRIQT